MSKIYVIMVSFTDGANWEPYQGESVEAATVSKELANEYIKNYDPTKESYSAKNIITSIRSDGTLIKEWTENDVDYTMLVEVYDDIADEEVPE